LRHIHRERRFRSPTEPAVGGPRDHWLSSFAAHLLDGAPARAGGRPTAAIYQTASGVRPTVKVEIKGRDVKTGLIEFSIAVDRDSMPVRPARCVGSPSRTELRTSFTLDDGSGRPLLVTATLPWQCRGTELRLP